MGFNSLAGQTGHSVAHAISLGVLILHYFLGRWDNIARLLLLRLYFRFEVTPLPTSTKLHTDTNKCDTLYFGTNTDRNNSHAQ